MIDDLPEIRDNIKKGFAETQKTVTSFINNLRKKMDGDDDEIPYAQSSRTGNGPQYPPRRSGEYGRRSADRDHDRYDADPEVLGDNFEALQLRDEEGNSYPLTYLPTHQRSDLHLLSSSPTPPHKPPSRQPKPLQADPYPSDRPTQHQPRPPRFLPGGPSARHRRPLPRIARLDQAADQQQRQVAAARRGGPIARCGPRSIQFGG